MIKVETEATVRIDGFLWPVNDAQTSHAVSVCVYVCVYVRCVCKSIQLCSEKRQYAKSIKIDRRKVK